MSAFNDPRLLKMERERREGPRCKECGYDLTGLTLATPCPECGTERLGATHRRLDPQTAEILEAGRLELVRYQVGFALAGAAMVGVPIAGIVFFFSRPGSLRWVAIGFAGVWALSVYVLLSMRFYEAKRAERVSEAARWVALGTQWLWAAAGLLPAGIGGWVEWVRGGLCVVAGLGLVGVFWEYGNLLEWAGDDAGGKRVRATVPYYLLALGWAFLGVSFFMFRLPLSVLWIMVMGTLLFVGPCFWLHFRITADVLGGVSMARWARVKQVNDEGRQGRIEAHRAAIEAEQGVRVDREERAAKARRAGADKPVGMDDFSD